MHTLSIALDWTPNVNHIGIFMAKEKGYLQDAGIDLHIIDPSIDHYQTTPGKKLDNGSVDLAIAPFETVISLNNKPNPLDAIAIYTILQEDLSCIVTLKSSGLNRPAALSGKTYASYKARYEDHIVQEMLKNDGATCGINCVYPEKLGIWNTLLTGSVDATWIFDNWEGVEADTKGIELHKFKLSDYQIPYGYSPIILARKSALTANEQLYKQFIDALQQGYSYVQKYPEEATVLLSKLTTSYDKENIDLLATITYTSPYFGDSNSMGKMNAEKIHAFLKWLVDHHLEDPKILDQALFTSFY